MCKGHQEKRNVWETRARKVAKGLVSLLVLGAGTACRGDPGRPAALQVLQAVIQGRNVRSVGAGPTTLSEAMDRARRSIKEAGASGSLVSWGQDPPDQRRSFLWDVVLQTGALAAADDTSGTAEGIANLLHWQRVDGAWPIMVSGRDSESDLRPGASQTAGALAVLGALSGTPFAVTQQTDIDGALARGLRWLQDQWLSSGGVAIAPGSTRISTEATALAIQASLAVGARCDWCAARQEAAIRLLTGVLWRGDHFARGADGDVVDDDQTGPHTHQSLASLALIAAHRANAGGPDPRAYNPLPWLGTWFTHRGEVMGRTVAGLGDRLAMTDEQGLLFGCDGGQVLLRDGQPWLDCAAGTVQVADPSAGCQACFDPYGSCASAVNAIPEAATPVSTVNAEITLLGAMAALAAGDEARAVDLLNAGLAMQAPSGGVIAIAGPIATASGHALGYPQNQRTEQYGYTALLLAALARRSPLAPLSDLTPKLPGGVVVPSTATPTALPVGFLPDPCTSSVASTGAGSFAFEAQARLERWLRWYTAARSDIPMPAACYTVRYAVSGSGPWTGQQLKIVDRHGTTHGLTFLNELSPAVVNRKLSLAWLGLFWPREGDDVDAAFELSQFELVALGAADAPVTGLVRMQVDGLQIAPGDCLEGSPGAFSIDRVSVEGDRDRLPQVLPVSSTEEPGIALQLGDADWQRILIQDRWQWSCATELVIRVRAFDPITLQLVLEDSNSDPAFPTGSRWFFEVRIDGSAAGSWQDLTIPTSALQRFEPNDPRPLDWTRIRKIAVAFAHPSSSQRIDLQSIVARAPANQLDQHGVCSSK